MTSLKSPALSREKRAGAREESSDPRGARRELDHLLRALSHDMSANFMLLESAFGRLHRAIRGQDDADLLELAAHVEACLGESKRFLGDLIRLGKTGSVEMEPDRVPLAQVVDEVLFEQQEPLDRRDVVVQVQQPLPTVWCNRHRLKQVVSNLVRNAILHGCDPSEPRITISAECKPSEVAAATGTTSGTAWIRVRDNGPGVEPGLADEAFLPGRRLPGAAAEGSGMGLAIVRKIAEHFGGSAWIDTDGPAGMCVVVALPLAAELPPGVGAAYPTAARDGVHPSLDHDGPHPDRRKHPHQLPSDRPGRRHRHR